MSSPLDCGDLPAVHVNHNATFEPVLEVVLALRDRVEDLCNQELGKINKQGLWVETLHKNLPNIFVQFLLKVS